MFNKFILNTFSVMDHPQFDHCLIYACFIVSNSTRLTCPILKNFLPILTWTFFFLNGVCSYLVKNCLSLLDSLCWFCRSSSSSLFLSHTMFTPGLIRKGWHIRNSLISMCVWYVVSRWSPKCFYKNESIIYLNLASRQREVLVLFFLGFQTDWLPRFQRSACKDLL